MRNIKADMDWMLDYDYRVIERKILEGKGTGSSLFIDTTNVNDAVKTIVSKCIFVADNFGFSILSDIPSIMDPIQGRYGLMIGYYFDKTDAALQQNEPMQNMLIWRKLDAVKA